MRKIHLVDGTFELFRCFHGAPRAETENGREVGAARGLLHTFTALLRQDDVSHVAVAFDSVVDGSDKKDRSDAALLRRQFPLAADVVRALGILIWPMARFQADDALATAAARYKDAPGVDQVVICSTDLDFTQCVDGDRVVLLDRIRKKTTDETGVRERFGVLPKQIPELFALVGDKSDGIPGIPGWGWKSASAVLGAFPTLEDIPDDPAEWNVAVRGAERLAATLRARRREAYLYRNLSIRRTDVPLPDEVEHLEWNGADRAAIEALTDEIGEKVIVERIPRWR